MEDQPGFDKGEIRKYYKEEALIRETAAQVIKDFGLFEMDIRFIGDKDTPYQELYEQVLPYIAEMLGNNTTNLFSLLYQIDIPDKWWEEIRQETSPSGLAAAIADAILQRELLKVLTRNHFRKQKRIEGQG